MSDSNDNEALSVWRRPKALPPLSCFHDFSYDITKYPRTGWACCPFCCNPYPLGEFRSHKCLTRHTKAEENAEEYGSCDVCDVRYELANALDHCVEEGVCLEHCTCPVWEPLDTDARMSIDGS
jgi:hypothetical protein